MNIEEARLYLEHTSKDDFNLEEWQKENRYQAIQVILREIERLNKENKILRENAEHNDKVVDKVNWENKRLSNIINEFDKWLDEESEKTILSTGHLTCLMMCKNKLQELKGSDNSE